MTLVMAEKDVENEQKIGIAGYLQVTVHGVLTTYPEPCLSPDIHVGLSFRSANNQLAQWYLTSHEE